MASGGVCASALNEFSLYSPGDQAALQAVVEDYFTCMNEDESESLPELEGILCVCVCIKINYYNTNIGISNGTSDNGEMDVINELDAMNELDVMNELDDSESVHGGSDATLLESSQPEVEIVENSDMHEVAFSRMATITLDDSPTDVMDYHSISEFFDNGCGCSKWNGKNCVKQFSVSHIQEIRMQCQELSRSELDLVILGQFLALMNNHDTVSVESHHRATPRVRPYLAYHHQGKPICLQTFLFLHCIGSKRLKNLYKSFHSQKIQPRVHGNLKRLPSHTLSFTSVQQVITFIANYAEENSILPGRIPGYKSCDMKILPSSKSKKEVWRLYEAASEGVDGIHIVAYITFCHLWKSLLPDIIMMRPMSDLCWQCKQNSHLILRSANCTDIEKRQNLQNALDHLQIVTAERSLYRKIVDDCSTSLRSEFSSNGLFQPPPLST